MKKIYTLNLELIPRCEAAPEKKLITLFSGDGAHNWGPAKKMAECLNRYECQDCMLVMEVDSSD